MKFYKYHPNVGPQPSLREQICALEDVSGFITYMEGDRLCIDAEDSQHLYCEKTKYSLKCIECPYSGVIKWVLEADRRYPIRDMIRRPELLQITVTSKGTPYRGVKVNGNVYWTDNEHELAALKVAVETQARAQEKICRLLKESE